MRFFEQRPAFEGEAIAFAPFLARLQRRNVLQTLGMKSQSRRHGSADTQA
jgi:hypothetical protein